MHDFWKIANDARNYTRILLFGHRKEQKFIFRFSASRNDGICLRLDEIGWLAEAIWEQFDTSNQNVCSASPCQPWLPQVHTRLSAFERVTHTHAPQKEDSSIFQPCVQKYIAFYRLIKSALGICAAAGINVSHQYVCSVRSLARDINV